MKHFVTKRKNKILRNFTVNTQLCFDIDGSIMKIFILLAVLAVVSAKSECDACFEGVCYSRTTVQEGNRYSGQLAVDTIGNIFYFYYEDFRSIDYTAAFDLDNIQFHTIPGIDFSFARTVDQTTRDVYIGGAQGIFKYNPISNSTIRYGLFDKTIWHMQYKNKIYYTIFNTKGLNIFENKKSKVVAALSNYSIDDFIIDKREDVYFMSDYRVYRLKSGAKKASVFANEIYSLSTDKLGNAFFVHSAKRVLYHLDYKSDRLIEVGAFGTGIPFKVVFDNRNNVIYHDSNDNKLYYLMPNYSRCKVSGVTNKTSKNKVKKTVEVTEGADTAVDKLVIQRFS